MSLRNRKLNDNYNIFFITTTCYKFMKLLNVGNSLEIVSESIRFCNNKFNARLLGYVLMPNHIHLLLHFENNENRASYMRDFKKFTATKIRQEVERLHPEHLDRLRFSTKSQVFKVWQDRFDEFGIETKEILEQKLDYIHNNPLQGKWSLAKETHLYKYSSANFYETSKQNLINIEHYLKYF